VRWLRERGLDAQGFKTEYGDEDIADQAASALDQPAGLSPEPDAAPAGSLPVTPDAAL